MVQIEFGMKTLAALSMASHARHMPVYEHELEHLRVQYYDLLSCFRGLSVQVDAARYMSEQMQGLFSFIRECLSDIIDHTEALAVRSGDSRTCVLLLDYEISQLLNNMTSKFEEFYVPRLYSVLKDFENQTLCYSGFRFTPSLNPGQGTSGFLGKALTFSPLASLSTFELITEKTSRIVDCCNDAWSDRQLYASTFVDDLEHYFALRSELRGLSRSVSPTVKSCVYKKSVCDKMRVILRSLQDNSDFWLHESVNNLFM